MYNLKYNYIKKSHFIQFKYQINVCEFSKMLDLSRSKIDLSHSNLFLRENSDSNLTRLKKNVYFDRFILTTFRAIVVRTVVRNTNSDLANSDLSDFRL